MRSLEVLFSPAEFEALKADRLREATCVVFDILRATTSIVTALYNGATGAIPVANIPEALEVKRRNPRVLLAGEREGYRITAQLSGSLDFDLGNSPREFTADKVRDKTIVTTTTNGTRALKSCRGAVEVLASSFLNLGATTAHLRTSPVQDLIVVCSGTHEEAALEDTLAAGALVDALAPFVSNARVSDSAAIARMVYERLGGDLLAGMALARNGKRLMSIPDLKADVAYCAQRDTCPIVVRLSPNGSLVRVS